MSYTLPESLHPPPHTHTHTLYFIYPDLYAVCHTSWNLSYTKTFVNSAPFLKTNLLPLLPVLSQ